MQSCFIRPPLVIRLCPRLSWYRTPLTTERQTTSSFLSNTRYLNHSVRTLTAMRETPPVTKSENRESPRHGKNTYTRRIADAWEESELSMLAPHLRPHEDETLDLILRKKLYLLQSRRGYRCNVDSHVLANFASSIFQLKTVQGRRSTGSPNSSPLHNEQLPVSNSSVPKVLDIGCGVGTVSILFCRKHHFIGHSQFVSSSDMLHMIEFQSQLVDRAKRNLVLNDLSGTVTEFDIAGGNLPSEMRGEFDIVLINPPFYEAKRRTASKHEERRLAQIESSANISNFLSAARKACNYRNPNAFIALVHDIAEEERILAAIRDNDLVIVERREMCHYKEAEPTRLLLELQPAEAVSGESLPSPSQQPIILFKDGRIQDETMYTAEIEDFFNSLPYPSLRIGQLRD